MKVYKLKYKHIINASMEEVFGFFSSPENLSKLIGASMLLFALSIPQIAISDGHSLKVLGWGAKSGPLKSFGVN